MTTPHILILTFFALLGAQGVAAQHSCTGGTAGHRFVTEADVPLPTLSYHSATHTTRSGGRAQVLTVSSGSARIATSTASGAEAFTLYPNPAAAGHGVQYSVAGAAAKAHVSLLDPTGRQVWRRSNAPATGTIPTDGLSPGVYLVRIQHSGGEPATQRVVIQ